jgi:hypothetical protein
MLEGLWASGEYYIKVICFLVNPVVQNVYFLSFKSSVLVPLGGDVLLSPFFVSCDSVFVRRKF